MLLGLAAISLVLASDILPGAEDIKEKNIQALLEELNGLREKHGACTPLEWDEMLVEEVKPIVVQGKVCLGARNVKGLNSYEAYITTFGAKDPPTWSPLLAADEWYGAGDGVSFQNIVWLSASRVGCAKCRVGKENEGHMVHVYCKFANLKGTIASNVLPKGETCNRCRQKPPCGPPGDQCQEEGVCDPVDGECKYADFKDGVACDDGDDSTIGDVCMKGTCVGTKRTSAPSTKAPPTDAPSTKAPATSAPSTDAPLTKAPSTSAPLTDSPLTDSPATAAPLTDAPLTKAPSTDAPSTKAPSTDAPSTKAPSTDAPSTKAPSTDAPLTKAPSTDAPSTKAPSTDAPLTKAPATSAPSTDAPLTKAPSTSAPLTDAPDTAAPRPAYIRRRKPPPAFIRRAPAKPVPAPPSTPRSVPRSRPRLLPNACPASSPYNACGRCYSSSAAARTAVCRPA